MTSEAQASAGKAEEDEAKPRSDRRLQSVVETVSDPDVSTDPAKEIDEKGAPFEGNHA